MTTDSQHEATPVVTVVACVRNEALRLPAFFSYYRDLGVARFLLIDHESQDGTAELVEGCSDVTRFAQSGSYAESRCGIDWLTEVLDEHCMDRWVLVVDADELFDWRRGTPGEGLLDLVRRLDSGGADACLAFLLDMYPRGDLGKNPYVQGRDLLEHAPFFDCEGYDWDVSNPLHGGRVPARGGPRRRLLWKGATSPSPYLPKVPLIRWSTSTSLEASTHVVHGARISEKEAGVLLHFKLLDDFALRAREEAVRGEHFEDAKQYRQYLRGLESLKDLDFYDERVSRRYRGFASLFEHGPL